MPDLRPFRGLRYDPARVPDPSAVLCPPYDVISALEREALLARSPHNAVRLELPSPTTAEATDADYARAADTLARWLADGTLRRDERPLIYVYEQDFAHHAGGRRVARSFFCRVLLEEYGEGSGVRPHERTMAGPREHRFHLLSAVRTHLSPVLMMYEDGARGERSAALLDVLTARPPDVAAAGPDGVGQRLWAVDAAASAEAQEMLQLAGRGELYIADGHHRYETALRYRDTPGSPPDAHFVLGLLYDAGSGGLELAPWHRVIRDVEDPAHVLARASELLEVQAVEDPDRLIDGLAAGGGAPGVLAIWTRAGGALLTVDRGRIAGYPGEAHTEQVRALDVAVLSGTLGEMIGASEHELTLEGRLSYTHDARNAVGVVARGEADVCFLLRPTPVEQVLAVAAARDFMPPKSTYFYPKAATGLVFDRLVE